MKFSAFRFVVVFAIAPIQMMQALADDRLATGKGETPAPAEVAILYILRPDDEIVLRSLQVKELTDKTFKIDQNGEINLMLLGRVQIGGHTVIEAEALIATKLEIYYVNPDVVMSVSSMHSAPVSVIGAVGTPGIQQIRKQTTLLDLLSSAGGVRTDAGPVAKITRPKASGPIPHPSARQTASGDYVAEADLKSLLDARNPAENIVIEPHDVVSIPLAEVIYVVGNVKKAGGFPLGGKPTLSVLQAISMAEGLDPQAAPKRARILRRGSEPNAERTQIAVDVQKIMTGKAQDILLLPNDILFVPSSTAKTVGMRSADIAIQIATRALIWR